MRLRMTMLMLGADVDDGTWYDSIAKQNYSVSQVYERLRQTSQYLHFVDDENEQIDSFSSFSAGFGDAVWFWCPGCAANARRSLGYTSGDADRWAYALGSITGIIGSLIAPPPTSVIAPPKADYTAALPPGVRALNEAELSGVRGASEGGPGATANRGYLDATGRFHNYGGTGFPSPVDIKSYSVDDLLLLRNELEQSVASRIQGNINLGFEAGHAERQAEEQALIRFIDKLLR